MALVNAIEIVNQGFLKAVPINQRFDASIIEPHLNIIDSRYLKTIFCAAFYDALIAAKDGIGQYNADLGATSIAFSTNANYETLYKEYILPYVALAAVHQALPFVTFQIGSRGVLAASSEFAHNVGRITTKEGVGYVQDAMQKMINYSRQSLLDYLCANAANYPLFCTSDCPDSECTDSDSETFLSNDLGIIFY